MLRIAKRANADARASMAARVSALAGSSFPFLVILYGALFCAYGTEAPFFPSFLATRRLSSTEIGIVLSAGTCLRLSCGPLLGMAADRVGTRLVLALAAACAGMIDLLYLPSFGFWPLLCVCMVHAIATAPLNPLADALALNASAREGVYPYGWIRGAGSASFLIGTFVSGQLVAHFGLASIIVASSLFFLLMSAPIPRLPPTSLSGAPRPRGGIITLLRNPAFRRVLIVAGMVIGGHAMSDAFAVIHWRESGISAGSIGMLLSEAVASEIVVFIVIGPMLLRKIGAGPCAGIAAVAGTLRWAVFAQTTTVSALAMTELLHGFTFSLVHLACMQVIADHVPGRLSATAQTLYGTLCLGIASALITVMSGFLYGSFGGHAFWTMSALSAAALPLTFALSRRRATSDASR